MARITQIRRIAADQNQGHADHGIRRTSLIGTAGFYLIRPIRDIRLIRAYGVPRA
ncbi:MAG: hypothetical protein ACE14L_10535 [Terriglobales bacterium]